MTKIKRNRLRYWTIKFITQHPDEKYKALVVDELRSKYRIALTDFLLIAEIRRQNGMILIPGQEILVKVKKADPWDNILDLEYFSEGSGRETLFQPD
jgi:hypothetical protein